MKLHKRKVFYGRSAPELNKQDILCDTSCQGSVWEGVESGNEGYVPEASWRPCGFVVRPNVQGRDVGINSELNSGKQSSGPGWTEAQRSQAANLEMSQKRRELVE